MMYYLKLYATTFAVFFAIDITWIGFIARPFYKKQLGFLLAASPNWTAALLFYALFVLGILVFVVVPGLDGASLKTTLIKAALFGLISYATYDLTNLATIENWPLTVTIVDMLWGIVLSTCVSFVSLSIARHLN